MCRTTFLLTPCRALLSAALCFAVCGSQLDICLILDLSGSVNTVRDVIIEFAYEFTRRLPIGSDVARVAAISFSDSASIHFKLDAFSHKREVLNALSFSQLNGRTGTSSALELMTNDVFSGVNGARNGVPHIGIVISDGWSNINNDQTIPEADNARNNGIQLYSVIVGTDPNLEEMTGIANAPPTEYSVRVANAAAITSAADELIEKLCTE